MGKVTGDGENIDDGVLGLTAAHDKTPTRALDPHPFG
jgi:hypothetical protein